MGRMEMEAVVQRGGCFEFPGPESKHRAAGALACPSLKPQTPVPLPSCQRILRCGHWPLAGGWTMEGLGDANRDDSGRYHAPSTASITDSHLQLSSCVILAEESTTHQPDPRIDGPLHDCRSHERRSPDDAPSQPQPPAQPRRALIPLDPSQSQNILPLSSAGTEVGPATQNPIAVADQTPTDAAVFPPSAPARSRSVTPQPPLTSSSNQNLTEPPQSAASVHNQPQPQPRPTSYPQPDATSPATRHPTLRRSPPQVIGRRQRSGSDDSDGGDSEARSTPSSPVHTAARHPRRKRRRPDMLSEVDGQETMNGSSRGVGNGTHMDDRAMSEALSRTRKMASEGAVNGSAQNGKTATHGRTYLGHDREEVTRILIQALSDMGYRSAAESVSRDSGYELENPTVAAFRTAVLDGSWAQAEGLLEGAVQQGQSRQPQPGNGLVLAPGADRNIMRIWLRQQKFLELLERRDTTKALQVLRYDLMPLCSEQHQKLHFLSGLLMCQSAEDMKAQANWDGAHGQSRQYLLSELSRCISPSVMLPEHRLAVLLEHVKEDQIMHCLYHTDPAPPSLYSDHMCDRNHFPCEVLAELDKHADELWQVLFSHDGTRLAGCGMDKYVIIWDVASFEILVRIEAHEGNITDIAWSPDDSMIVSCSQDRWAKVWNTERQTGALVRKLDRFDEPVTGCVWTADSQSLFTGTLHKDRSICQWDLEGNLIHTWTKKYRTSSLDLSPDGHRLVAMDDQQSVHVYNFRTRELEYELNLKSTPTSVSISQDSRFLLVNKSDGEAQLIDMVTRDVIQKYRGHVGGEYMIRSGFGGANESFVISGSEDGKVFIWHKSTGIPVQKLEAHNPRCNAVSWNPVDPCMFATCGDDGKIKIWSNKERVRLASATRPLNGVSDSPTNGWRVPTAD
ncbi:WD40-repeat-containing domain protein [Podospora conica]|nr:WD40-repeat-containing domain protein [Schizothecium conicum]